MKKINITYMLVIVIVLLIAAVTALQSFKEVEYLPSKDVISLSAVVNNEDYLIQKYSEKYKKSNINIYYPVTKYEVLNKYIQNFLSDIINSFKNDCDDQYEYTLFGNFDFVKYGDYMNFIFHTSEDFRGAHPIPNLYTITYNIKDDAIVNVDTLIKKNNNILNLLSKYSLEELLKNKKIKELGFNDMVISGTKATKDNFKNIVFTGEGLKILFGQYQVAPYAYGEFSVTIPYNNLNLQIN